MEKARSGKKEQQENKKKKNHKKPSNTLPKHVNNYQQPSKKTKKNKNVNDGEKTTSKKKQGPNLCWFVFVQFVVITVVIGFLYLVDYEKFTKVKLAANASLNKTLGLLPPELVMKGKEFVNPTAEIIFNQLNAVMSKTSTFLNTNPVVRDHWINAREISSVCGGLFVDYLRTLYLLTCWCCGKLMP